jgi:hypothetical protein
MTNEARGVGSDGAAARHYRTSRMTVWRWRHNKSPLPRSISDDLAILVQKKVEARIRRKTN